MRALLIACFVLTSTGCGVKLQARPQSILQARGDLHVQGEVQGEVQVDAQAAAEGHAQVQAQAQTQTAVAIEGSLVVEFFGIPLDGVADVVFVLDRSGSMAESARGRIAAIGGATPDALTRAKFDVAREELLDALARLPEGTRINVIYFNDGLEGFAPQMVALEAPARDGLVAFVKDTAPSGRTALVPAMRTALLMNARRVVLLSDGLGNVGGDSFDLLRDAREAVRGGVRIDTIGLGPDQDTALMHALASESGGVYQDLR